MATRFARPTCTSASTTTSAPSSTSLRPESIDTHEFVWERYTGDWLRTSVSTYWYKADRLITLTATDDPAAFLGVTYVNEGEVRAKGLELEAQMRLWRGAKAHMSYALQNATDQATGATLPELAPTDGQGALSAPLFGPGSSLAIEVLGIGGRQTVAGNQLGAATTANLTLIKPLGRSLELVGTVRNLFNLDYAVPASDEHLQDSIPQNGRTFRVGFAEAPLRRRNRNAAVFNAAIAGSWELEVSLQSGAGSGRGDRRRLPGRSRRTSSRSRGSSRTETPRIATAMTRPRGAESRGSLRSRALERRIGLGARAPAARARR